MRFLTRLHVLAAAAIMAVVYFAWILPSLHLDVRIQKAWSKSSHQLVVFGDDWSDSGSYRVSPPKGVQPIRSPDRGQLWVEVLCKELVCDYIDNFARAVPTNEDTPGSMIDNDIHANATVGTNATSAKLFDFKTQVQQWINFEKQKRLMPSRTKSEWTVFTVLVGHWDLWEYVSLERRKAIHAIDDSIKELFAIFDIIAEHSSREVKIVLPTLMDISLLPRFQVKRRESAEKFAQDQHMAVTLWTYWNIVLSQKAAKWAGGDIYIPSIDTLVADRIRAKQLYSKHISDATGAGKKVPLFDDVESPCVSSDSGANDGGHMQAAGNRTCDEPGRRLFWDDMSLGGTAHQLIGREAGRLISSNKTANPGARQLKDSGPGTSHSGGQVEPQLYLPPGM